ncbi:NADH-quinone oxidoreductase subunit E [Brevirhabdus sp.]|uniref:NADH-quinone oxidoreductase subunit E n=1 Tax=Brevirhabdus sp. TaxID=2004514 RepID=UPI0040593202
MLRRLHAHQPESFAFTPANQKWAEAQITKYPEGRQASAIIPLLWRAQEQEGWLSRPAIEHVCEMLDMAYIRGLEVATFYFMFQLQPVGSVAHVQICGTTSCMICGAEDLMAVCREKIALNPHELSADGRFSWEEVECLGACANAPMAQIGKDYYEDLTEESLARIIDGMAAGEVPTPGPQNGRFASEPLSGLSSLAGDGKDHNAHNASVALALDLGDTIRRIDGSETPLTTPWPDDRTDAAATPPRDHGTDLPGTDPRATPGPQPAKNTPASDTGVSKQEADEKPTGRPDEGAPAKDADRAAPEPAPDTTPGQPPVGVVPPRLDSPRGGKADDLKQIRGIGPKLERQLNALGFYHLDQIAALSEEELIWLDDNLEGFRGRAGRDDWVGQAGALTQSPGAQ